MSAIIVSRGDVDLEPILDSLPDGWEKIVWNNGQGFEPGATVKRFNAPRSCPGAPWDFIDPVANLSVYGRYAAIQYASHDCIYVQDDDCIVSDPQAIVAEWNAHTHLRRGHDHLVANMPQEFRPHYPDSCLVGFGACFHRDLPDKAFAPYVRALPGLMDVGEFRDGSPDGSNTFRRTCDVVFTTLTPRVLVDVPVEVLPHAHDSNRMWKQPDHYGERTRVLEMARKVRDA